MKNSNLYAANLKKLFSFLRKGDESPKKPAYHDPIEAVIFAVLCEESAEARAKAALKKIQAHFVDFNDLRVARAEEIVEIIGQDIENPEKCAGKLTSLLNAVFQKYDCLTIEDLTTTAKKSLKEIIEKFIAPTGFVSKYIMLTVFNAHCVPMTEKMIQYLKTYESVENGLETPQVIDFVEKQISAANAYAFYALARRDSELANPKAAGLLAEKKAKAEKKPKAKR